MSTADDFLAHYGVKGMRWGVRREGDAAGSSTPSKRGLSEGQKRALKIGAGLAVTAGAALTVSMLIKNGTIPVSRISAATKAARGVEAARKSPFTYYAGKAKAGAAEAGKASAGARYVKNTLNKEASDLFNDDTWNTSVKDLMDQISNAHRDETKYMINNSAKSGMGYDPHLNRYSPESRSESVYDARRRRAGVTDDYMKKYGMG